VQNFR